ncbi:NUDIX hydrolase [Devriesea agamarum]|uniref:NUDIX hydrolase n=1 Tax=Devriesea agamarum TaxID=472569 RepID=UPI00071E588F|nr:NUDIX domain-containing protein [Devriesea agamarum]
MATPDFVLSLREKIGHAPLWLSGVTAIVLKDDQVLCVRRSDNHQWTPVTGIIDPGEEPARAAAREVLEETAVVARAERLLSVQTVGPVTYDNGDVTEYLDLCFGMRYISGDPHPADGENIDAQFFPLSALPEMNERFRYAVKQAVDGGQDTQFIA